MWWIVVLMGCGGSPTELPPDEDPPEATDPPAPPSPTFDCTATPDPIVERLINGPRGFHGLAIDSEGRMVGSDGVSLVRSTAEGETELWVANIGAVDQLIFLPNGDLIAARFEEPGLWRIDPVGGRRLLAPDVLFYGVAIGPDGNLYAAGAEGVFRVDPESGHPTLLLPGSSRFRPHSLAFTPNHQQLVVGVTWPEDGAETGGSDPWVVHRQAACTGQMEGETCSFEGDQTIEGECVLLEGALECWDYDFGATGPFQASAEQRTNCQGRSPGDACPYVDGNDEVLDGTCHVFDGPAECWFFGFGSHHGRFDASPAQAESCLGQQVGGSCSYTTAAAEMREGVCETVLADTDEEYGCWDFDALARGTRSQRQACVGLGVHDACDVVDPVLGRIHGTCEDEVGDQSIACWEPGVFEEAALDLLVWDLDEALTPIGVPMIYAERMGGYHDALAFDVCGGLWVADFATSDLYRVAPDHTWARMADWSLDGESSTSYGHALLFGTGTDGWRADALYVALPYAGNQVREVTIGVPGANWTGEGLPP